jgi:putative chitinase
MSADPVNLIDVALLSHAAPSTSAAALAAWPVPLAQACRHWEIATVREVACFIGNGAVESQGFTRLTENLNYSAERLHAVWPNRFPTIASAEPYAHNPERLANKVYAGRFGNGDEASGDGWRFRGAGLFQITFRANHEACAAAFGVPLEGLGDYLRTPPGAAWSAGWFFQSHNLGRTAATPGVEDDTRAINGGLNGLAERRTAFDAIVAELVRRGA